MLVSSGSVAQGIHVNCASFVFDDPGKSVRCFVHTSSLSICSFAAPAVRFVNDCKRQPVKRHLYGLTDTVELPF